MWHNDTSNQLVYDISNRMISSAGTSLRGFYEYDPSNKRVYQQRQSYGASGWVPDATEFYFYGVGGKKLGTYFATVGGSLISWSLPSTQVFFRGKLIQRGSQWAQEDIRASIGGYFPYGENSGAAPNDSIGFGSYTRDSVSGLDYAVNRYYGSGGGRFASPDPYIASGGASDPRSWNRYGYVLGDPVNFTDRTGQMAQPPDTSGGIDCDGDTTFDCWGGDAEGGSPLAARV